MKLINLIKDKCRFYIRRNVSRLLAKYYNDHVEIETEIKNEICLYGERIKKTYKYQRMELATAIIKFKISFWETFI